MFGGLRYLFGLYSARHLRIRKPGFSLLDETGRRYGQLDTLLFEGGRLIVSGWTWADRVELLLDGVAVEATPRRVRRDASASVGAGASRDVGFCFDLPNSPKPVLFTADWNGRRFVRALPRILARDILAGRLRLVLPFFCDLLRTAPALVRWLAVRDTVMLARVYATLGLDRAVAANLVPMALGPADSDDSLPQVSITIILPVYNAFNMLTETLNRILRHTDLSWRLLVVEDRSSDVLVRPFLREWAAAQEAVHPGRVVLIENTENLGFIRSVNQALERAVGIGDHVVLLNSDTFVPAGWARRLLRPILTHADVATVTPMSNDAEIFSVPLICRRIALHPGEADSIDELARQFHPDAGLVAAPTGVGFCMAISIDHLRKVGLFDESFGRGYGEEVDWCQRARALGARHLGLPSLFMEHCGAASFGGDEKLERIQVNNATISKRYPRYDREVEDFIRSDPMLTQRLALAITWAAGRGAMPIYLAHSLGGGAEKYLAARIADEVGAGKTALVLRVGGVHRWALELHCETGVISGATDCFDLVRTLLEPVTIRHLVYSTGVGDRDPLHLPATLLSLKRSEADTIEVLFHDYFPISPSYCLLDSNDRFSGTPDLLNADRAHSLRRTDGSRIALDAWRAAWRPLLAAAKEIVVFSHDSKGYVLAAYPELAAAMRIRPHRLPVEVPRLPVPAGGQVVIAVLGHIGLQKGAKILSQLSRLAAQRGVGLVVVGTVEPAYTLARQARVHGEYRVDDLPHIVARHGITCWLIPSIWPETFSYTTHEALATGLPVYCFDLGAQAEAVRRAPNGQVIPLEGSDDPAERVLRRVLEIQ